MVRSFRRIVWPFAIAETLVWAAYYYSFPALLPIWEADLGFSKTMLTGAFTCSLIVSALLAPVAGRLVDRGHALPVYAGSTLLAVLLLCILAQVSTPIAFYGVWIGLGIAMSGSLYEACFSVLTHSLGTQAKRAIMQVTLVAGFAGTVSFPAAHYLTQIFGWRGAVLTFAAVILIIATPLIVYGCLHAGRRARISAPRPSASARQAMGALRTPTFWFLGITFTLMALDQTIIVSHVLPIMTDRGLSEESAVFAASMFGPMQVLGRIMLVITERHIDIPTVTVICFLGMGTAGAILYLAGFFSEILVYMVAVFVILQGASVGMVSIIRPVIVAILLGRKDFGVLAGLLAVGFVSGSAMAPILTALVWRAGGYDLVLLVTIAVPATGLVTFLAAWFSRQPQAEDDGDS